MRRNAANCLLHTRGRKANLQVKRPVVGVLICCPETREATRAIRATAESLNMIDLVGKEGGLIKIERDCKKKVKIS